MSQRRHELGVRSALGATLADIVRLVASLLYGVAPSDPWSLVFVLVTLVLVAAVASTIPAWRASRADPLEALRADSGGGSRVALAATAPERLP